MSIESANSSNVFAEIKGQFPGYPAGVETLMFQNKQENRKVPVFDLRDESHHDLIAQNYANFKTGVVFGIGVYGVTAAVEYPNVGKHPDSHEAFWIAKKGRSPHDKIPLHIHPKDMPVILDMKKVHPEFRQYIYSREAREDFYRKAIAIHMVIPIKEEFPHLHPIFITKPDDWAKKKVPSDQWKSHPTAAAFWWDDPDLEKIYLKTQRLNPFVFVGISSFNDSNEDPAWNEEKVIEFITQKGRCPFEFMVRDTKVEQIGVESSHPQIALPLEDEEPVWKVYRTGATDIEEFLYGRLKSRHRYQLVDGFKRADRNHPVDTNLDPLVLQVQQEIAIDWEKRHPPKKGISKFIDKIF